MTKVHLMVLVFYSDNRLKVAVLTREYIPTPLSLSTKLNTNTCLWYPATFCYRKNAWLYSILRMNSSIRQNWNHGLKIKTLRSTSRFSYERRTRINPLGIWKRTGNQVWTERPASCGSCFDYLSRANDIWVWRIPGYHEFVGWIRNVD